MCTGKNLEVINEQGKIEVNFTGSIANVKINGQDSITTVYSPTLDLDQAAKELHKALVKEMRKDSILQSIFPSFGRDFKIMVSNILKARAY